jgi:hypothetical protein
MQPVTLYYHLTCLKPLCTGLDEQGDTYGIYRLPTAKPWICQRPQSDPDTPIETKLASIHLIKVCVLTGKSPRPAATRVVPIDEKGEEWGLSALTMKGIGSPFAAFHRLGFVFSFSLN